MLISFRCLLEFMLPFSGTVLVSTPFIAIKWDKNSDANSSSSISHKLDEVFAIADRVQVLRNGESVYEGLAADTDKDTIINSMCGRELKDMYPVGKRELGDVVFEIKNFSDGFLNDISINVRRHEIVGLYGLMGSGCSEVLQCAFGARRHQKGSFSVNGKEIKINKPIDAKNAGLAYVPAERKREGLTFLYCKEVRPRYTVLQMAYDIGVLGRTSDRVIERLRQSAAL